jgi:hypothetical protein
MTATTKLIGKALMVAAALSVTPAFAEAPQQSSLPPDALIKSVLAKKAGDAVCFAGTFDGQKVNVWDYDKGKPVPVPGVFQFGKQVMRPEPYVYVDQPLTAMTLLVGRDEREHETWDEMHDFTMSISLRGWPDKLQAAGECPFRLTDKPIEGSSDVAARNTTTLYCGIDCDGGGMEVERVAGTSDVVFRFNPQSGGLRMSGGCSPGSYHVGGDAKPFDEKERAARKPPPDFRLSRIPDAECDAFRKSFKSENTP